MRSSTVLLAASGWAALAATELPALSPLRIVVTLAFLGLCPGIAVLRIVAATRREDEGTAMHDDTTHQDAARPEPLLGAALAVAVSLALATLVSEALFLAGGFTMPRCVMALSSLTTALALLPEALRRRGRPAAPLSW